ncbi:UNVERIFIED_CONTAM: hypothetical protein PYX00_010546 [Menopon gallinae]|uniref:Protein hairy n=1 Tax=Menopon gallinae TaxID=328185 RepID=A0AAW2HG78_9NEOP
MVAGGGTMASAPPPAIGGNGGCTSVGANTSGLSPQSSLPATAQGTTETGPARPTRTNENRRSNKPIMEKRRRARINNCLNELKTLILDAMKKDPARHSKLEKADILEMTVKHLETLQRQQVAMAAASDPNVANKFRAGFTECAGEVGRFPGLDGPVKRRLLQHLANCLNATSPPTTATTGTETRTSPAAATTAANPPLQVHILRAPVQTETPVVPQTNSSNIILANTNGQGLQLVPTRLPNGDIALILPSSNSFRTARVQTTPSTSPSPSVSSSSSSSPLPMLIPIPNRTGANSPSPVAFDRLSVNPSSPPRQITILTTQNSQRIFVPQKEKSVPLLTTVPYQYSESEKSEEPKSNEEVPVIQPPVIRLQKDENYSEDGYYDRNRVVVTQDGQLYHEQPNGRYVYEYGKGDRETFLHIPEREYYQSGSSPRSPYVDDQRYDGYYPDHVRSYSPDDMQKPLALVTKKKYEEYAEGDERPWRPW